VYTLSLKGAKFIAAWEGFRAECYDDAVGNCTIGFGHLIHYGRATVADLKKWKTITRDQALNLLKQDASKFSNQIPSYVKVALTQAQVDALTSLAFNCGIGAVEDLARVINLKPKKWRRLALIRWRGKVRDQFHKWDHAGGKVLPGLERRRLAEGYLFTTGRYRIADGNKWANA